MVTVTVTVVVLLLVVVTAVVTVRMAKGHGKLVPSDPWPLLLLLPRQLRGYPQYAVPLAFWVCEHEGTIPN